MADIDPEAGATLVAVPFTGFREADVQPYRVVTDVPRIVDFDRVEELICTAVLRSYFTRGEQPFAGEGRIYGDRIGSHLRPKQSNKGLLHGYAVILPFDAERAAMHDAISSNRLDKGRLSNATPGLSVVYGGEVRSSRNADLGMLLLESEIYLDRQVDPRARRPGRDYLRRTVGLQIHLDGVSAALAVSEEESAIDALKNARFALKHLYHGGLPGLKR